MLSGDDLDDARRSEVLFWSARSHLALGESAHARERLEALLERYPKTWHAAEARTLLDTSDP